MDSPGESNPVVSPTPPKKRRNHRKVKKPFDGRFVLGRRVHKLAATFRQRLGIDEADPDPLLLSAIDRAAQLQALAEQAAAGALRADPKVGLDDLVRLQRLADLAVRRLRLDQSRKPTAPTLSDLMRGDQP
jgi:hypothetical protein